MFRIIFIVLIWQVCFSSFSLANESYVIKKGDCLRDIAKKLNIPTAKLYQANKKVIGSNPNLIFPGQVISTFVDLPSESVIDKPVERKKVAAKISSGEEVLAAMGPEKITMQTIQAKESDKLRALSYNQENKKRKVENRMVILVLVGVLVIIGALCFRYPVFNFRKKFGKMSNKKRNNTQIFICIVRGDKGSRYCCVDGESIIIVDAMKMSQFILSRVGGDESRITFGLTGSLRNKIKQAGFANSDIVALENETKENFFKLIRPHVPRTR